MTNLRNCNFNSICRTCLSKATRLHKLQTQINNSLDIHKMLCLLLPQLADLPSTVNAELLPAQICSKCLSKLQLSYEFQQNCINSEQQLREALKGRSATGATAQSIAADTTLSGMEVEKAATLSHHSADENSHDGRNNHKTLRQTFVCTNCQEQFGSKYYLQKHIRLQHNGDEVRKAKLQTTHYEDRPFLCALCGKTFQANSNLMQHMSRHSDARPYQCKFCVQKFQCSSGLSKHMHVHRQAAHVCDTCGAKFSRSDSLRDHKEKHTGSPKHKCEQCNKVFFYRKHLRVHTSRHAGERPYKCEYCPRAFTQKSDLTRHLRFHIGEKTYNCSECAEKFKYFAELRAHEFKEHLNKDIPLN